MATKRTVFLIGATGFVGGYVLELLGQEHPEFLLCLLRNANKARADTLRSLNRNVEVVQGTLDDQEIISTTAEKADVVINVARSDHMSSVEAVLEGLTKRAKESPNEEPPTFLHISCCGGIAENASDLDIKLVDSCSDSTYGNINHRILEASTRAEHRLRTFLLFPGLTYGIGKNQGSSVWVPTIVELAIKAGHAGTWVSDEAPQSCIHVRDVATAAMCVLDNAIKGKLTGGDGNLFFATSRYSSMSWKEIDDVLGDLLHLRGIVKEPGSQPLSREMTETLGSYSESFFGGHVSGRADRLARLGWKAEWTKKERLRNVLPHMLDRGIRAIVPGTPGAPL